MAVTMEHVAGTGMGAKLTHPGAHAHSKFLRLRNKVLSQRSMETSLLTAKFWTTTIRRLTLSHDAR
jgi:hypothetical protein